jgi:hypothetical protein
LALSRVKRLAEHYLAKLKARPHLAAGETTIEID